MENTNIWCWIIPALVGLICAILGYLLGRGNKEVIDNSEDIQIWKDKNSKLTTDKDKLAANNSQLQADLDACRAKAKTAAKPVVVPPVTAMAPTPAENTGIAFDAAAAKAIYGKKVKQDDLKLVEGIGPKIEGLFHTFDIKTWKALSEASVAKCQEVLNSGGERYRIHDPSSWPMQAKMCYEGKWADLQKWQSEHKHGKL
ncbi:MAG: hypothetical protein ABJD66_06105 [Cellulophaga sp.]|uniref:hypothetical protein n=1 Tax=unclassified Cellulophaga TaxID=2634405 RepID=UPI000C2BAF51|nr:MULTISPECIES: hypothetical protein [unclassified Cellulophaga]MDO6491171.1 hypothetical protein [Cellulophaga sp. 2_MG-2023]MDO6495296.1 hypothetical protein [Cellulophaga sp. 3_MG-2023]PKB42860.1 putative flap endonuclease-1-like 5' DNA nuclease [Cellulophaga sp. RHA19]